MATPARNPNSSSRPQTSDIRRVSENSDPNIIPSSPPPPLKSAKSPVNKSAQSKKLAPKTPGRILAPPPPLPLERKFIVAKKNSRRTGDSLDVSKCRKEAYEALRASQEGFFWKDGSFDGGTATAGGSATGEGEGLKNGSEKNESVAATEISCSDAQDLEDSSKVRMMRSLVPEEAMSSVPEPGSGRVKHLVKAFENLLSISNEGEAEIGQERRVFNWALSGLHQPDAKSENVASSTSVFSSAEFLPSRDFDLRSSWEGRTSGGGRRSRRNSSESLKRSWNKKLKVTSQHPFKLRTELRGRIKEEQFLKKVKEMLVEEEKKLIPIAQGLPWTTDEPECLVKPQVKQSTEPIDLVLHSDVRAVERAEFDNYVSEKMNFAEQLRLEREKQRKLEEEEEIRRLRRELVPKAQPMPYFDRPFVAKKSERPQTIPKEPRFRIRPKKISCSSVSLLRR